MTAIMMNKMMPIVTMIALINGFPREKIVQVALLQEKSASQVPLLLLPRSQRKLSFSTVMTRASKDTFIPKLHHLLQPLSS
jgi:hypothetical protein